MKPLVLDVCCSQRSFWHDKNDDRVIFVDKRIATYPIDTGTKHTKGRSPVVVRPNVQASFTDLPFKSDYFNLVVFDPPHIRNLGETGYIWKKYGTLFPGWEEELREGFSECFRVLQTSGTLVFKWSEYDIPLKRVLSLTEHKPLFGHKSGKQSKTHWVVFIK